MNRLGVHDLPYELISHIFILGRGGSGGADIRYLQTISSVCSVWRNVAISTANLWSTIVYEPYAFYGLYYPFHPRHATIFPTLGESKASRVCERVGMFLARSRSVPIDLNIIIRDHGEEETLRIANIVMPHLWRCRSLIIRHNHDIVHQMFFPLPGRLERLEKLEVLVAQDHSDSSAVTLFTEHGAPPLYSLCLKTAYGSSFSMEIIPENTLTHLDMAIDPKPVDQVKFLQFLRRCTVLEVLRLMAWGFRELPENVIPISLPWLRSLHVTDTWRLAFTMHLHTPNIVELCLEGRGDWYPRSPDVPPATILQLKTVEWDTQSLHDIRHHHLIPFSSVENLILRHCYGVAFLVRYLAGFPDEEPLEPVPNDPPEAIKSPESQGHHLFPRLEYLEITAREAMQMGVSTSWLKALLDHRPSLRVAMHPFALDALEVTAAVEAQLGPRFSVIVQEGLDA